MATTTNFGWETPDDTDLVKDGAAAIRTALGGVDTSFVDLKGGTTGQVLAKASNTDLDFVWSADAAGMTNPMTTTGDMIFSSSGSTPARRAIGTNGQILTVLGGVPVWASPAGGGKILQVVMGSTATQVLTSTNTLTDTGLSATITPSATSSRILVMVTQNGCRKSNSATQGELYLLRNTTTIATVDRNIGRNDVSNGNGIGTSGINFVDSPATTSAITYKTQQAVNNNASFFVTQDGGTATSTIVLMEVGA